MLKIVEQKKNLEKKMTIEVDKKRHTIYGMFFGTIKV